MSESHPWGMELSFSQLRAYIDCPWLHRLRYIDNMRSAPTPPSALGVSIHGALETFHAAKGKDLESLLDAYEDRWVHAGFGTPQEQLEYHRKGEAILRTYWAAESKSASRIVCVEREFGFPLGSHRIRGKIDRIDQRPDGTYEIIDYKTHLNIATAEETAADLQLRIYAFAARASLKLEPAWMSFYYVAQGSKVSAPCDASGDEELKALLIKAADEMSAENTPVPNTAFCPRCPLRGRCAKAVE
ncbi:MAG: PD-(D/E)XK nuclease family protein [Elusimicrobiota bacterium]